MTKSTRVKKVKAWAVVVFDGSMISAFIKDDIVAKAVFEDGGEAMLEALKGFADKLIENEQ